MSPQTVHQYAEKVALVSDAASPIGRAVSMQLALQGSYVVGIFPAGGESSITELVELGTLAHAVAADPSSIDGARAAAAEVERLFERLDLLVNCLKFKPESSFEELTEAHFREMVDRNFGAAYFLTKAVFGLMKGRPKPKIVNLVSALKNGGDPIFDAMQSASARLTLSLAREFPRNFRVNCIEVREGRLEKLENEMLRDPAAVAPDDVARAVLFLLSSESAAMNGQVLKLGPIEQ